MHSSMSIRVRGPGRLEDLAKKSFSLERMSVSLRAGIPPFYVMDVWLAAAERQRTHGDLVNLSAGQPSAGAPAAVRTRGEGGARQHRPRLHRRARHPRTAHRDRELLSTPARARRRRRRGGDHHRARRADSCWRSWRASTRVTAWRSGVPGIRATATSCRRSAARSSRSRADRRPDSSPPHRCSPSSIPRCRV